MAGRGDADSLLFLPGDRLLIDNNRDEDGDLVLLQPRGFGAVMLGRCVGGRLLGEPGSVPASPVRWRSVGSILAVERPLNTNNTASGTFQVLGTGHWLLSRQTHALLHTNTTPDTDLNWITLDRLLQHRSTARSDISRVGIVVGRSLKAAAALPPRPGWIRFVLLPPPATIVTGLWSHAGAEQANTATAGHAASGTRGLSKTG